LIAEWSSNPKPLQAPRAVHDVGDCVLHDFVDPGIPKHNENYGGGNDGDKFTSQGRKSLYHAIYRMQYTTTYMSTLDEDQWPCLEDARHVGSSGAFNVPTKGTYISSIKPAPDPIPNLSPLGGEQTSTAISKFCGWRYKRQKILS
jgi:hypothetical protein